MHFVPRSITVARSTREGRGSSGPRIVPKKSPLIVPQLSTHPVEDNLSNDDFHPSSVTPSSASSSYSSSPLSMGTHPPILRRFLPGDPFFAANDRERELFSKQWTYKDPQRETLDLSVLGGISEPHVCTSCPEVRYFPNAKWLELHLLEVHEPYFQSLAQDEGRAMFECYVMGCSRTFHRQQQRNSHLHDDHQWRWPLV